MARVDALPQAVRPRAEGRRRSRAGLPRRDAGARADRAGRDAGARAAAGAASGSAIYDRARQECVAINERRRRHMDRTEFLHRAAAGRRLRLPHAAAHAGVHRGGAASRSRSASAPTAPSSASSTACCSSRCRSATPIACTSCRCCIPTARSYTSLSAPDFMSVRADAQVFEQIEADRQR